MKTRARVSVAEVRVYGMREVRTQYNKNVMLGLLAAALVHIAIIGAAYFSLGGSQDCIGVPTRPPIVLGPPPTIGVTIRNVAVQFVTGGVKASMGIPVAVPDFEISQDKTIATQGELSSGSTTGTGSGIGTPTSGSESGAGGGEISISDPDPEAFVVVEKLPVPVKQVLPEYPRLAREAGVEGTVWVKALVTKEGRVKKAIIIKSDTEIFNDVAIAAAMQYVFTPAIMNSGPVAVWASIPFRFKLTR